MRGPVDYGKIIGRLYATALASSKHLLVFPGTRKIYAHAHTVSIRRHRFPGNQHSFTFRQPYPEPIVIQREIRASNNSVANRYRLAVVGVVQRSETEVAPQSYFLKFSRAFEAIGRLYLIVRMCGPSDLNSTLPDLCCISFTVRWYLW